jgi:hypothetical protein
MTTMSRPSRALLFSSSASRRDSAASWERIAQRSNRRLSFSHLRNEYELRDDAGGQPSAGV